MSVIIEFYTLIIRRDRLEALLPGGWDQYLAEYGMPLDGSVDENLVRDGAMNDFDFVSLVSHWKRRGLVLQVGRGESRVWKDAVVTASLSERTIKGCDWLEISDDGLARFVGKRKRARRRTIRSNWSEGLVSMTMEYCHSMLATPPEQRSGLLMKSWDDEFAILTTDMSERNNLIVTNLQTRMEMRFKYIEDLINAGWVID